MKAIKSFYQAHKKITDMLLVIALAMFILNLLTVPTSDDLGYSISNGFLDILHREYIQYMTWTGRTVAHLLARFFLTMPKWIFDIGNTAMFISIIWLINRHAVENTQSIQPERLFITAALIFLFVPVFGQTVLWQTGSCNYLWTTSIILFFLYLYRKEKMNAWLLFFIGLVAGWTNENTGGALILLCMFFMGKQYVQHQRPGLHQWTGIIGASIGFVMLIIAPGNRIRALDFVDHNGLAYKMTHSLLNTLHVLDRQPGMLILLLTAVLLFTFVPRSKRKMDAFAFVICGLLAVGAMMLSPVPVLFDRSMFGATILVITGIVTLLYDLPDDKMAKIVERSTRAVLALFCAFAYTSAIFDLGYTRYQWHLRERWVFSMKAQGNLHPVIPQINSEFFTSYNAMKGLHDILSDEHFVNNTNYALTHGLKSVTATTWEQWQHIYRTGDPQLMNCQEIDAWLHLAKEKDAVLMIVSTSPLDCPDTVRMEIAEALGMHMEKDDYIAAIVDGEDMTLAIAQQPSFVEATRYGQYIYVSSSADGEHADILVNGKECSNNQKGITVAALSKADGHILDSVTWNKETGSHGSRVDCERKD